MTLSSRVRTVSRAGSGQHRMLKWIANGIPCGLSIIDELKNTWPRLIKARLLIDVYFVNQYVHSLTIVYNGYKSGQRRTDWDINN